MNSYLTLFVPAAEVLPPPPNFSASLRDGELLVTWSPPISRATKNLKCFEYQLDMGDQVKYVCVYADCFRFTIAGKFWYFSIQSSISWTFSVQSLTKDIFFKNVFLLKYSVWSLAKAAQCNSMADNGT